MTQNKIFKLIIFITILISALFGLYKFFIVKIDYNINVEKIIVVIFLIGIINILKFLRIFLLIFDL